MIKNRTLILFISSIICLILFSQFKPNSLQSLYKVEYDRFWTNKVHSGKNYDMLILGDSRIYRGISPAALNEYLPGLRIKNFGFSSGILDKEIFSAAEKRIDQSSDRKIILIGISPGSLTEQENKHFQELSKMTHSEVFDNLYTKYYLSKYLFSIKPAELLGIDTVGAKSKLMETFNDDGWVASQSKEYDHSVFLNSYEEFWSKNKVSEAKINDLITEIRHWKSEKYNVFAFRAPSSVEIDSIEDRLSGFDEKKLSDSVIRAGGHWIAIKEKHLRYSSYDGIHMEKASAILLSKYIGEGIREYLINN